MLSHVADMVIFDILFLFTAKWVVENQHLFWFYLLFYVLGFVILGVAAVVDLGGHLTKLDFIYYLMI